MKRVISFSLDSQLIDKIKQEATGNDRKVSVVVNRILAEHFDQQNGKRRGGKK